MMEDSNPELESFRQQWRAEVSARSKGDDSKTNSKGTGAQSSSRPLRKQPAPSRLTLETSSSIHEDEEEVYGDASAHNPAGTSARVTVADKEDELGLDGAAGSREPSSALEHYERAVERESQGNLGDSLNLYRKAFKMDDAVDLKYKKKHFPPSYFASKLNNVNTSNAAQTVPGTGHHSLDGPPQTIKDLLAGFEGLTIEPAQPTIEGTTAPPCPISTVPHEILVHILTEVAILDVASFVCLAQVCKRLAYMVNTEHQIWKRVCIGTEVGFGAMHYTWQRDILGGPLDAESFDRTLDTPDHESDLPPPPPLPAEISSELLLHTFYSSSWQKMFRLRPRIRYNGCYISTVNYMRPGQASPSQITWNSPVHIVTYYRYLRFFRDGTVISLLTTSEPSDVVPFLTKPHQAAHQHGQGAHLPSAFMQSASRGRWRLSGALDGLHAAAKDGEGDVFVETEGVGKYIYRMELELRSAGKAGPRNNKLAWKGYWHYNKLTDDWGEFGLRNDKAFFWSRVRSYGVGE